MSKLRLIRLAASIGVICMMQACAIPSIITRKADAPLPAEFAQGKEAGDSAAKIDWTTFFTDPNLSSLITTAIANNKEVAITIQRMQMAQNEIQARRGEYLPFVSIGAGADTEKVGKFTRNGAVEESLELDEQEFPEPLANFDVGLHASWELDVWKKLRNATKVAALEYMASVEGKNFLITNLVAEVANEYYELMSLDNQLANLNQYIQIQQNALGVTRELLNFGRTNSLAVKRFEAEVAKNESERYAINQRIVQTENHLNVLLGRTPQPITRSSDTLMTTEPAMVQTGVPTQLLARRPDIRQAELELQAADLNISVAKANFYPSFAIRAGVGFEAFKPGHLLDAPESLAYSVVGDVVAPLINRAAITAAYKNASAAQVQAAFEYEQTIITAFSDVATKVAAIDNLAQNYRLKSTQVDALNSSVDVANQLFSSARADYLEVLLAQREALEARNELIETKQKQLSAAVNLYRALGGGWQEEQAPAPR
jgi:NodT family efflux transporter outer membrane factor (OMF) lipoprotein